MIKLQFKLPQALISRRTVFHAPAFQQKGINRLMDIYQIYISLEKEFYKLFNGGLCHFFHFGQKKLSLD